MKKIFLLCSMICSFIVASAQTEPDVANQAPLQKEVFTMVEEMPQFRGGDHAMVQYLSSSIRYPEEARQKGQEGKVYVKFVVNADGNISDVTVIRSAGKLLDDEAVRVVKAMPAWTPGKQNGRPVNVYFQLPISFKLESRPENK